MDRSFITVLFFIFAITAKAQEKPIPLYSGAAPGSEKWTWDEKTIDVNDMKITLDVSKPTLVPYLPVKPWYCGHHCSWRSLSCFGRRS